VAAGDDLEHVCAVVREHGLGVARLERDEREAEQAVRRRELVDRVAERGVVCARDVLQERAERGVGRGRERLLVLRALLHLALHLGRVVAARVLRAGRDEPSGGGVDEHCTLRR
jgi:hypothetical protein